MSAHTLTPRTAHTCTWGTGGTCTLSRDVDSSDAHACAGPRRPWGPGEWARGAGGQVAICRTVQEPLAAAALMELGLSGAGP